MSKRDVGSGGAIERTILFFAGCVMGSIGAGLLYLVYRMSMDGREWDYEAVYMTGCIGLAFFLLRGAWFTVIPEKRKDLIKMSHDR